jgi:hypothetical protein
MQNTGFGLPIAFVVVICFGGTALAETPYSKAVQALVADGEVSQAEVDRRKKSGR